MENRLPLYDSRNTVTLSQPGKKNKAKREVIVTIPDKHKPLKIMAFEPKVAMTGVCRWCGMAQGDHTRAVCRFCRTCQYCGLQPSSSRACEFCGNNDLDRNEQKVDRIRGRSGRFKARKKKKRTVRRLGPQRRSRRPRMTELEA